MSLAVTVVDAFTSEPFSGNPAAVCVLQAAADEAWMQAVAREMNLSETAFLYPDGVAFNLRWFTPTLEVDLCGHATLASAHVLWQTVALAASETARFQTASGLLTARQDGDWIELDFPALPEHHVEAPPELAVALGTKPLYVGRNEYDYLVEVESEAVVRGLKPDLGLLARLPVRGVCVTSVASSGAYDFVSRFFGPAAGVNEDPVTGSAHCSLAPFWAKRLNKEEMVGFQASARGGVVRVRPAGDRVYLAGQAVTVLRSELLATS